MLTDPLPHYADLRKLVKKGARFDAQVPLVELERLSGALVDSEGVVDVNLSIEVDDQGVKSIQGSVEGSVKVVCQRCLGDMQIELKSDVRLGLIWEDVQASSLPKDYDPLVVGEDQIDLYEIIEDELLLALPIVSYHDLEQCTGLQTFSSGSDEEDKVVKVEKVNPFSVLEGLKPKK